MFEAVASQRISISNAESYAMPLPHDAWMETPPTACNGMAGGLQPRRPIKDLAPSQSQSNDKSKGLTMKRRRAAEYLKLSGCLLLIFSCVPMGRTQESTRKVLKKAEVQYPDELKKRGIGGTVQLKAIVKADGTVKDITVIGGSPALADAAKASVRQWKFVPADAETPVNVIVKFDPNS